MTSMMTCSDVGKLSDKKYTSIRLKDAVEVFQDYKKSALLFSTCYCDWKCCHEAGVDIDICQNQKVSQQREVTLPFESILKKVNQSFTDAVIFGGLEPILQADEVVQCIEYLRKHGVKKDIVVYTGYYLEEIDPETLAYLALNDCILKCGRFIPDRKPKFDAVLGITLASDNQYGVYL